MVYERTIRKKILEEREVMKKYRVNVVGTKYVTTETEDKAIEHTQDMLDHIHKSLNMQVFSIAEVREEQ
jgi:predicted metal-binding transcription factor (methanogenesis marker protein 9)